MRFSLPAVAAGGLMAVAALTVADIATSQADAWSDDAAILSNLEFTHDTEIELSNLAQEKGSSQELKDMATTFGTAHNQAKEEVKGLGDKLDLKLGLPDDNPMKASAKENYERLKGLEGKEFDKGWVDHQVTFHQNALESVKSMIPTATNDDVKALLNKTQSSVSAHLDAAKALQAKIVAAN